MEEVLELCQGLETVSFEPEEILMAEGQTSGGLYVLVSGTVEIFKRGISITEVSQAGAIFGEVSILLEKPHPASVVAVTETVCRAIPNGREFMKANPAFTLAVAELQARRLKGMIGYVADVKAQFGSQGDHLGMVGDLLLDMAHRMPMR